MSATVAPLRKPVKCPNCAKKSSRDDYPFCSKRCREMDLHHWFSESYTIATHDDEFECEN